MSAVPVVAIDGPSGAGKGLLARGLAARLAWHYLDSGALYRALAWRTAEAGLASEDGAAIAGLAVALDLELVLQGSADPRAIVGGVDVTEALRSEDCAAMASRIAVLPEVRSALLAAQRAQRRFPGLVADGRDMGSVVFPDATLKVYLSASLEARAERRCKQLKQQGMDANLPRLLEDLAARDQRDQARRHAPLRPAQDAHCLDSSALAPAEVLTRVMALLRAQGIFPIEA